MKVVRSGHACEWGEGSGERAAGDGGRFGVVSVVKSTLQAKQGRGEGAAAKLSYERMARMSLRAWSMWPMKRVEFVLPDERQEETWKAMEEAPPTR